MNLVLCGMMGAGKTTIGVKIAELTGRRWYDTDGIITDRHGKISDIFEFYGEPHFRKSRPPNARCRSFGQTPRTAAELSVVSRGAGGRRRNGGASVVLPLTALGHYACTQQGLRENHHAFPQTLQKAPKAC